MTFTLKNPYFIRHLINLGVELLPLHRIRLPWKKYEVIDEK